jgi:hypothetical protein
MYVISSNPSHPTPQKNKPRAPNFVPVSKINREKERTNKAEAEKAKTEDGISGAFVREIRMTPGL